MSKIVLTGATGYIGHKLLLHLLQECSEDILVPVRASSREELERRYQKLMVPVAPHFRSRVIPLNTDLEGLNQALDSYREDITTIIHNAAKTAFNIDEITANSVNRDASLRFLEFASELPHLINFTYVSTLYASGMNAGPIHEDFISLPSFANHYERSKWEVEEALRTRFFHIPWRIARVATVISDDLSGTVVQHNAIHNTLKLFYYGLISLLPGKAETPIHLVDGEFTAASLTAVVNKGLPHKIYHVCYDQTASISLGRFIDVAFEEFNKDETFKARRLLKPLFTDEKSFDTLVMNMKGFGGSVLNQGLASISPFGRQLFIAKEVHNEALQGLLVNYQTPPMEEIVRKTCQYLAQTRFAKSSGGHS